MKKIIKLCSFEMDILLGLRDFAKSPKYTSPIPPQHEERIVAVAPKGVHPTREGYWPEMFGGNDFQDQYTTRYDVGLMSSKTEITLGNMLLNRSEDWVLVDLVAHDPYWRKELDKGNRDAETALRQYAPEFIRKYIDSTGLHVASTKNIIRKGYVIFSTNNVLAELASEMGVSVEDVKDSIYKVLEYFQYRLDGKLGRFRFLVFDNEGLNDGNIIGLNPNMWMRVAFYLIQKGVNPNDACHQAKSQIVQFFAGFGDKPGIGKGTMFCSRSIRDSYALIDHYRHLFPQPYNSKDCANAEIDFLVPLDTMKLIDKDAGTGVYEMDLYSRQIMKSSTDVRISNQCIRAAFTRESRLEIYNTRLSVIESIKTHEGFCDAVKIYDAPAKNDRGVVEDTAKLAAGIDVPTLDYYQYLKNIISRKMNRVDGFSCPVVNVPFIDRGYVHSLDDMDIFVNNDLHVVFEGIVSDIKADVPGLQPGDRLAPIVVPYSSGLKVGDIVCAGRLPAMDNGAFLMYLVIGRWSYDFCSVPTWSWALNGGDFDGDRIIIYKNLQVHQHKALNGRVITKPDKVVESRPYFCKAIVEKEMARCQDLLLASYIHSCMHLAFSHIVDVQTIHRVFGTLEEVCISTKHRRDNDLFTDLLRAAIIDFKNSSKCFCIEYLMDEILNSSDVVERTLKLLATTSGKIFGGRMCKTAINEEDENPNRYLYSPDRKQEAKDSILAFERGLIRYKKRIENINSQGMFSKDAAFMDINVRLLDNIEIDHNRPWKAGVVCDGLVKNAEMYLGHVLSPYIGASRLGAVVKDLVEKVAKTHAFYYEKKKEIDNDYKSDRLDNDQRLYLINRLHSKIEELGEKIVLDIKDKNCAALLAGKSNTLLPEKFYNELRRALVLVMAKNCTIGIPRRRSGDSWVLDFGPKAIKYNGYRPLIAFFMPHHLEVLKGHMRPARHIIVSREYSYRPTTPTPTPTPTSTPTPASSPNKRTIYTGRVGVNYAGMDVNVTNTNKHPLAPGWDLTSGLKKGEITWSQYKELYIDRLREIHRKTPEVFHDLLLDGTVITCYCKKPDRCHRGILIEVLVKLGKYYDMEVSHGGEL